MNKAELINAAAEKAGLSKKDTENAINAAIEVISQSLAEGDKVQLVGFGAFEVKCRAERIGRNPKTKEALNAENFLCFQKLRGRLGRTFPPRAGHG